MGPITNDTMSLGLGSPGLDVVAARKAGLRNEEIEVVNGWGFVFTRHGVLLPLYVAGLVCSLYSITAALADMTKEP